MGSPAPGQGTASQEQGQAEMAAALFDRIADLENRVAALEARLVAAPVPAAKGGAAETPAKPEAKSDVPWLVICAAVAAVVKGPHVIRLVTPEEAGLWPMEGRLRIFASHRVR